jgi:hypothetical protein
LARSDFKVRREAGFLTVIGLSHTENVAGSAPGGVTNHDQTAKQHAVADDSGFTVVFARVLDLHRNALEDSFRVLEVETSVGKCAGTLGRIKGNAPQLL